ncbi:molybdopterin-containing oxidoreductase family protein [Thalassobaculum salexigens]|uniref:molybdopterin-containing oxidoreductase family protein n=1 Tax=Thalassobaculum salexigens TaxID=455360 RepID=UPI0003FA9159|nr:molybdopterin-dependent oxidoreductase [Thalassobaculum salexigens]
MPDGQASITKPSVCPLDCPDTCSLDVTVEGGKVTGVRGSTANPLTEGVVCNKVSRYYPHFVHGEGRLTHPLKRVGRRGEDRFERISWDEALDLVHDGLTRAIDAHGPQSVVPLAYAGPHGMLAGGSMDFRFFHQMGATLLDRGPMCGGVKGEAFVSMYGAMPGTPPEQGVGAELIIVWSNNVTVSNLHFIRTINRAKAAGAKIVVVDPKRIKAADQADMHVAIRPGTDVVLAFALAAELERIGAFDQAFIERWASGAEEFMEAAREWTVERAAETCGIPEEQIRTLAAWYAEASPALIGMGNGMERNQNGGNSVRAVAALPVLCGKWGVRGGGVIAKVGAAVPKTVAKLQRTDLIPEGTRRMNIMDVPANMLRDDLDPKVAAVFVYNHNPIAVFPDQAQVMQAFSREDIFVVGCEVQMTDSMRYCDVILPACSHFEHADIFPAYGQTYLQRADPVIAPVGEALPNTEIFRRLAARFGYTDPCFAATDVELMDEAIDGADPRLGGLRPSELPVDRALNMTADGAQEIVPFATVFPKNASGKAELASDWMAEARGFRVPAYRPVESTYPLALITPSSSHRTNATFGGHAASDGVQALEINPADAAARGIEEGDRVRVHNDLGETVLRAVLTDAVRPGSVYSDKGTWMRTSDTGLTVNALLPTHKADLCEGACFNDARVEVSKV